MRYNAATRASVTRRRHSVVLTLSGPTVASRITFDAHTSDHELGAWLEGSGWRVLGERVQRGDGWVQDILPVATLD